VPTVHRPANACKQAKIIKALNESLNVRLSAMNWKLNLSVKIIKSIYPRNKRK
jgi:hypothetical protein